tara:strand:- start:170 stop:532 length:363 start_codon:yes stop_codon:yes gene_type:complete
MNEKELEKEDFANYSNLLHIQFVEYARREIIPNDKAHVRFLEKLTEMYGPPLGGPVVLKKILNGKKVLPSEICITVVKKYLHCPLISVFKSLIKGSLNAELVDVSNRIVARALISDLTIE